MSNSKAIEIEQITRENGNRKYLDCQIDEGRGLDMHNLYERYSEKWWCPFKPKRYTKRCQIIEKVLLEQPQFLTKQLSTTTN